LPGTEETAKASKDKLQRLGFHFKYLTHIYTTKPARPISIAMIMATFHWNMTGI
jgi:hypothetical protein